MPKKVYKAKGMKVTASKKAARAAGEKKVAAYKKKAAKELTGSIKKLGKRMPKGTKYARGAKSSSKRVAFDLGPGGKAKKSAPKQRARGPGQKKASRKNRAFVHAR
jgi:hypothetical protein